MSYHSLPCCYINVVIFCLLHQFITETMHVWIFFNFVLCLSYNKVVSSIKFTDVAGGEIGNHQSCTGTKEDQTLFLGAYQPAFEPSQMWLEQARVLSKLESLLPRMKWERYSFHQNVWIVHPPRFGDDGVAADVVIKMVKSFSVIH